MFSENSVKLQTNDNVRRTMEAEVIKALQNGGTKIIDLLIYLFRQDI